MKVLNMYKFKNFLSNSFLYIFLIITSILFLLPILWWILFSIKDSASIVMGETLREVWIPNQFLFFQNAKEALSLYPMGRFFINSLIVTTTITFSVVFLASISGYAFAKFNFIGRNVIFKVVLALLMIPQIVIVIPLFEMIVNLKMVNTYQSLIIPFLVTPFGIFMMRQFMYAIPNEYIEAARVEGASEIRIFFGIVLPLSKNAFATLGILTFLFQWGLLLWPLISISRQYLYTLPVGVSLLFSNIQVPYNAMYAITLLFSIPVLVVYLLLQKMVMNSLAMTGLKG